MKRFKALAMVKHPRQRVWETVRDQLPALVPHLGDIDSVTVESREPRHDGSMVLVNVWRANARIPPLLQPVILPGMLTWTDRAEWRPEAWECRWQITPHFLPSAAECAGTTRYEDAMGGRGTRITMDGQFEVRAGRLPGITALFGGPTAVGIETFVTGLVPRNFQKLGKAVNAHLDAAE